MKALRAISLTVGIGALLFTVRSFLASIEFLLAEPHLPWRLIFQWPTSFYYIVQDLFTQPWQFLEHFLKWSALGYLRLSILLSAPVLAVMLAKRKNRSPLDWFVLVTVFPFLLAILALLREGRASANPYGGFWGHFFAVLVSKSCGRCGKAVPLSSRAGQCCPFCHAYWSYERTIHKN